jgi:hypothetical protein
MDLASREQSRPPIMPGRGSPRGTAPKTSHKPAIPSPNMNGMPRTIVKLNTRFLLNGLL